LAGDNLGTIANCWAGGSVSNGDGGRSIAGLVGTNVGPVIDSYSTGAVSVGEDTQYSGALIGRGSGSVEGCFWDMDTSGQSTSAGGQGRTTAEMQTAATFLDAGWDFLDETENGTEDIWRIDDGNDYPRLWWERERIAPATVTELNAENFDAEIAAGVILVEFYASWCPACVAQGPILDEVAERLGDQARVAKLDADQARDIALRYEVWAIPTLVVFCEGVPSAEFVGTTDADTLVDAVLRIVESKA
jgi:thioredoxin